MSPVVQSTVRGVSAALSTRQRVRRILAPVPGALSFVRLVVETVVVAFRYRATGLAAEAAFFTLLSLPPLLLALVAGAGFVSEWLGPATLLRMSSELEMWALRFLTPETVDEVIMPTFVDTLTAGRADILSVGFLVSLWSGSRALHVFLDTISIMYGQGGDRGVLSARILSLAAYLLSTLVMGLTLPLVLIGPDYLQRWLPEQLDPLGALYWPLVAALGLLSLTGLYHFATPQRSPYWRDLPGALLAIVFWVVASALIRIWAGAAAGGTTVFGPLTAPIILMVWLYFVAFAVLVGAALNAAIRRLWPPPEYRGPRARASEWWEERRASREARREERASRRHAETDEEEAEELSRLDGIPGPR